MSLLWVLRRYIDSIGHREEEERARRHREARPSDPEDDDAEVVVAPLPVAAPVRFVCRLCGHRSGDGSFCPDCLAPTMEVEKPSE